MMKVLLNKLPFPFKHTGRNAVRSFIRNASSGLSRQKEFTQELRRDIESHWRNKLVERKFNPSNVDNKFYILSMFPYPSGNLHMGHARLYIISDAIARFHRLIGKNVLHPMGWDSFGLPAENAANQRNIAADVWTKRNIEQMKDQFLSLGCLFDWDRELSTCDPSYYKWTQFLFLKLFNAGLAYQKEASVNWDPVDKTVLADEQVDSAGHSWRSGVKVEKKLLRQWFIKSTKFSKSLYDGLDDPSLVDWRDIAKIQRHWIGKCDGWTFDLLADNGSVLNIWTKTPEHFESAAFIAIRSDHPLNKDGVTQGTLNFQVRNPFNGKSLPVIVADNVDYVLGCDTHLGLPSIGELDEELAIKHNIPILTSGSAADNLDEQRQRILSMAQSLNVGGYASSSHLKDWLISRQRNWGTPIPIVHCPDCGAVPVNESDLPVLHSKTNTNVDHLKTTCPKCNNPNAQRESDTMDTFVDSSWYFLRYLDPKNDQEMFDKNVTKSMPVDLYIGGKEHALLHLYSARFVNHFLHSIGLVPEPEPFKRLLCQGIVKSLSYRVKSTGQYLNESDVKVDATKNTADELSTGQAVEMRFEKMSKSKFNGVDPSDVIAEHGIDSVRLLLLAYGSPRSDINWPLATLPDILNWQRRIWLTVQQYYEFRSNDTKWKVVDANDTIFVKNEQRLWNLRNDTIRRVTYDYQFSYLLYSALKNMQNLTKAIRSYPKHLVKSSNEYERALASLIIMIAPMAPHFASELWSQFIRVPNRINDTSTEIDWDADVLEQSWPKIDSNYALKLDIVVNGIPMGKLKFTHEEFEKIDLKLALRYALEVPRVKNYVAKWIVERSHFAYYPNSHGTLELFTTKPIIEKVIDVVKEK